MSSTANLSRQLEALGGDIHVPLQEVSVPMYMLNRHGKIVWLNDAGEVLIPGGTGRKFTAVLAPDQVHRARRHFALRMLGQEPFVDHETVLESRGVGTRSRSAPWRSEGGIRSWASSESSARSGPSRFERRRRSRRD